MGKKELELFEWSGVARAEEEGGSIIGREIGTELIHNPVLMWPH